MAARLNALIVAREFKRPYKKILNVGGHPKWRVMHDGGPRHGLGRKNPRRGWKQHYAKFPQRGLAQTALILHERRESNRKARREKTQ